MDYDLFGYGTMFIFIFEQQTHWADGVKHAIELWETRTKHYGGDDIK